MTDLLAERGVDMNGAGAETGVAVRTELAGASPAETDLALPAEGRGPGEKVV